MSLSPLMALEQSGWKVPETFSLDLPEGRLEFCRILRWLPGRRASGEALWNDRPVFAKLFFGEGAGRYAERELKGLEALRAGGLPTPALLAVVPCPGGGQLLLSEFISDAQSLEEAVSSPDLLAPAFALLGRLHGAGLIHTDLHLGNFLRAHDRLLLIDGDGVRPGEIEQQLDNLALLLSQLPVFLDECWGELLSAYGYGEAFDGLAGRVQAWRQRRLDRFLAKTLRNCTQFAVERSRSRFLALLRSEREALQPWVDQPDFPLETGRRLKSGGTCTVAAAELGGQSVVVKRYNLKNWRHGLSRAWRPSRAWHSWQEAHRLAFYGIATPKPLAMLEERWGPLRGRAFLVTEFCPGPSLMYCLEAGSVPELPLAEAITGFFSVLCRLRITHGDLKATNLLWHQGQLLAIDLDAMTQHRSEAAFRRAWRRDRARLLRNWSSGTPLHHWLEGVLPRV